MATVGYITISNTGNISAGLKADYRNGTYRKWKPAADTWTGLDGSSSQAITSEMKKWRIECTLMVPRKSAATGYAQLEGSTGQQCVEEWAISETPAKRLLKVTDCEGTTRDMLWEGDYKPIAMTGGRNGDSEMYMVQARFLEQ